MGTSSLGFGIWEAASLEWLLSRRRLGPSLTLGCGWHCRGVSFFLTSTEPLVTCWGFSYLVRVSEPGGSLLLAAHERDPVVAAAAKTFPDVRVAVHPSRLLGLLERVAGGGADAVAKAFVVPERGVLQHQPAARLANTAPSLPLVAVSAHPSRRVKVALEAQLLLVRDHVGILGVHVLGWRWDLLLVQGSVQVRWVRQVGVVTVERVRVGITLKHPKESVRH